MPAPHDSDRPAATADPVFDAFVTTGDESTLTADSPSAVRAARYALGDEIGHGGMGVVYRAVDSAFGRDVAVKVLHEKYAPDSGAARRFADEARITGQLQHPAIPPVHDLGTLPDGRPFLAMKLIRGDTLDRLLAQRPDRGHERGRFVAAFEQVCQALAYAHAHNVIHRDLKPANVMVGNFGEVQVMDWGLAKVLPPGGHASAEVDPNETTGGTQIQSLRDSDGAFTQAGSVLGTPAFMPPEQAIGAVGKVDARSDVFGLGAILAVILTGKPPFAAGSAETVRLQAAQGMLDDCFARLDDCGADPELVALCKRCLSPRPADRPSDAGAVAQAVAALRAAADERARQAELDRVKAEGDKVAAELQAAEQKKRRRVQLALFAMVGVLLLGVGAFAWWQNSQIQIVRQRHGRNAEAVAGLLDQCRDALRLGDADKAEVVLEAARKRSAEGGAQEQSPRLERLAADLALLRDLDKIDRFRWTVDEGKLPAPKDVSARYREPLGRFGADPDAVPPDEVAALASGSTVRDRLVTAFDVLLRAERTAGVRAVLQAIDANPFRDDVRDAVLANDPAKVADLGGRPAALEQPPGFAAFLGDSGAIGVERRRQLLQVAVSRRAGDLGLLLTLAFTYPINRLDGADERLRWCQAAVAAAPANSTAHNSLGNVLRDKKDLAGAEAAFMEAIRLDPKYASAHNGLGNVLRNKGDLAGAEVAYKEEASRLDPTLAVAHSNLGILLWLKKDLAGAEAAHREAIRLDPKSAHAHNGLGDVLRGKKDLAGAEAAYKEASRLDPTNAMTHFNLGNLLWAKKDLAGAEAAFKEAIRLFPKLSTAHNNLGGVLWAKKDLAGAEAAFKEAIRLFPKLSAAHSNLGWTLQQKGDLEGAVASFEQALRIDPKHAYALSMLPRAERMRELLPRLPDVLTGKTEPKTPAEACDFANLCTQPYQKRYVAASRLYEGAFAAEPKLNASHRYYAAYSAALAAGGEGVDAPTDAADRATLRSKALAWLCADLALWKKRADSSSAADRKTAAAMLAHWLVDSDLSGVREAKPLGELPAAEREKWQTLWADVKATLAAAQKPPPPPERLPPPLVEQ